ncbi:MAG: tryptophan 7-halogenase [Erythrobacter sp.]|nr:MAG: tryptophan 7-halogenase [Erythrobacter sp.]
MSEARALPRSVVVAGGGLVAVLAAVALRRALPATQVTVVVTPAEPAAFADHASSASPHGVRLLEKFGMAEADILSRCGGSHRLVTRYADWSGEGAQAVVAYGSATDPALASAFVRDWGGGRRGASTDAPPASLAEVLAQAGRFAAEQFDPANPPGNPLPGVEYALRWNAPALRDLVIAQAQAVGVQHRMARTGALRLDESGDALALALALDGQGEIAADLFVDCTGPAAALLAQMPGAARIDWSAFLPVRQVLCAAPGQPVLALEDRVTLTPAGWLIESTGRDGLHRVLGLTEGAGETQVMAALGGAPVARAVGFVPGRAKESWIGNVVALGDAAALFEPLGNLNLDCALRQLDLLLELLPGLDIAEGERAEFNRRANLLADGARDLVAAHYAAPRAAALFDPLSHSPELELALDQFTRRGRSPFFEEWPITEQERAALFAAVGIPRGAPAVSPPPNPQAERILAAKAQAALQATPPYQQWLASVVKPVR